MPRLPNTGAGGMASRSGTMTPADLVLVVPLLALPFVLPRRRMAREAR